jgi:hypothetical protein
MTAARWTIAALALAAATPAALPTPQALFQQAWQAAGGLPRLVAAREQQTIAGYEMEAVPEQALRDYRSLFQEVHDWPEETDTPAQRAQKNLKGDVEDDAVRAFVRQQQFQQAISWMAQPEVPAAIGSNAARTYDFLVNRMLQHNEDAQVPAVVQQAAGQNQFPLLGAKTAIASPRLSQDVRWQIALQGIAAAGGAEDYLALGDAPEFLTAVHQTFPAMDSKLEDALSAMLAHIAAQATSHPGGSPALDRVGGHVLALLQTLDADRAEALRARYPSVAAARDPAPRTLMVNSTGQLVGVEAGTDPIAALEKKSAHDPAAALAGAAGISDGKQRFVAFAALADAMATAHPTAAAQAAEQAYKLFDKDRALAETGSAMRLGHAYFALGQAQRAAEVADATLAAADLHAAAADDQFDISTPDAAAQSQARMGLPALIMTIVYKDIAAYEPALSLTHARACQCRLFQPLILARVAEGMTPAGALAHQ